MGTTFNAGQSYSAIIPEEDERPRISKAAVANFGQRVFEEHNFVELFCRRCGKKICLAWGEWLRVEEDPNEAVGYQVAQHVCPNPQ